MIENDKIFVFGDIKYFVDYLSPKDIVFLSHRNVPIIGTAQVKSKTKANDDNEK